jgi:hypothetical protein
MARLCNLLFTATMFAGLCLFGVEPASAEPNMPKTSRPNLSPKRPDLSARTRDMWQVIDQVNSNYLGGARNSKRHRTQSRAGKE